MTAIIKTVFVGLLCLQGREASSQNCDAIITTDKFTKDKGAIFYLEKPGGLTTTLDFDVRADYPDFLQIQLHAGTSRGDNSRTAKYFTKKIGVMMYFIFDDGTTKSISQDYSVAFGTSISIDKTDDIVEYLKNHSITDIRVIINEVDIKVDYRLTSDSKTFFQRLMRCIGW